MNTVTVRSALFAYIDDHRHGIVVEGLRAEGPHVGAVQPVDVAWVQAVSEETRVRWGEVREVVNGNDEGGW